jgi:hypothetical protein
MNHVAAAFGYPFRKGAARAWLYGLPLVLFLPLTFIAVLGYAVAAVRASAADPAAPPPPFAPWGRLLKDGFWASLALAVLTLPFAVLLGPLAGWLRPLLAGFERDPFLAGAYAATLAAALLALPWGILLLVLMPAATARFALTGSPRDLFDWKAALGTVRRRFPLWNLVVVAIVTAWGLGLAGLGLLCLGAVPGVFFAILVSAHATAVLDGRA